MAMEINSVYGNYASTYTNSRETKQTKETKSANEAAKASETRKTESAQQNTQDYLKSLKEKYPDVNITVGKGTTAKSFMNYMLGSSGTNNIYIEDNILQKMASDPEVASKYEKVIGNVVKDGEEIKKGIESHGHQCLACGTQIDGNGRVSYWGVSYNPNAGKHNAEIRAERQKSEQKIKDSIEASRQKRKEQSERIEEKQAERRAEEKEQKKLLLAKGDSVDDVVSKIGNGDAEVVSEAVISSMESGSRLNLTV